MFNVFYIGKNKITKTHPLMQICQRFQEDWKNLLHPEKKVANGLSTKKVDNKVYFILGVQSTLQ